MTNKTMNRLPPYIVANGEGIGLPVIIRTEPPYLIGRMIPYEDIQRTEFSPLEAKIFNYSAVMVPTGCFVGGCDTKDAEWILKEMAVVMYQQVLHPCYNHYKKWCEDRNYERTTRSAEKIARRANTEE